MDAPKPKGFGKFDNLLRKLVKVKPESLNEKSLPKKRVPKMPSPCCGVESAIYGKDQWRCGQCGRKWKT